MRLYVKKWKLLDMHQWHNQLLILGGGAFSYRPVVQTAFCIYLCYLCIILYISLVIWNMCDQLRDFSRHCTIQNTVVEVRSKCPNIGIMLHMTCIFAWYADWVKYVFYTNTYIRYSGFKCISFCTHSNVLPMMVEDTSPIITVFKIEHTCLIWCSAFTQGVVYDCI